MNKTLLIGLVVVILSACSGGQVVSETPSIFESEGYEKAVVIKKHKVVGCGILLKLETDGQFLQPLNLKKEFEKNGLEVWLQYRPIRPAQGACNARWIHIESIQSR